MVRDRRTRRQRIGAKAERLARQHLLGAGLEVIQRNYRCRFGEIDIIAHDAITLIFAEVRYRNTGCFGGAAASVNTSKQSRLIHTAQYWLHAHAVWQSWPARFDVIAMDGDSGKLDWIQSAFSID